MKKFNVKELTNLELVDTYGGALSPSPSSGFWYDVFYYASYGIRMVGHAFRPTEESLATAHQNGA